MATSITNTQPIVFQIGEENKPVVYGLKNFNQSIFNAQLELLFSHVQRKMEQTTEDSDIFNDVYDNNIIAFIGERGAGKTSCMYSSIKILKDAQEQNDWHLIYHDDFKPTKKLKFMKTIDPSCFDKQHNILEMLIGEMYCEAMKKFDNEGKQRSRDAFQQLIVQFQQTKRHLRFLSDAKPLSYEDDELEELGYLSSGVDLRESMKTLIDCFLCYMGGDILVIGIDDIDLNTSRAYSMVEQIRKYLILPKVMILMAVKLEQLDSVIRLELAKEFKEIMYDGKGAVSDADLSEMVERYLNKLIPLQARIYLPKPSSIYDRPLVIRDTKGGNMNFDSVREAVPSLIFAKCRYLFYNTKGTTSLIVPRNLRDLRMLIRMLYVMPDYNKADTTTHSNENKLQFQHYFFGSWLDDMNVQYKKVAHQLINETEPTLLNKKTLELMKTIGKLDGEFFDQNPMLGDILNPNNKAFNISVGDTLYVLNHLEAMETSAELRKLIFFIKSLYSIRLYEYYDRYSEKQEKDTSKPYRGQSLEGVSDYEKLMGGSLFLLEGDTLLPKESGDVEREIRNIEGGKFFEMLRDVVKKYNEKSDKTTLFADNDFVIRLNVIEFFMLTISRYIWTSDKSLNERGIHKFRLQTNAYYDRAFDVGTESIMFDILAPFFTLINVRHSYKRFDGQVFDIAKECPRSLYHQLKKAPLGDVRSFLSRVSVRNAEIIDDLFAEMQKRRGSYRMSDNALVIKSFYDFLADYKIYTYDKEQKRTDASNDGQGHSSESYYKVTFPEFKVLANLFADDSFVVYFKSIYNKSENEMFLAGIEAQFFNIWSYSKTMKGSSILDKIQKNYPEMYDMIGEEELSTAFDRQKVYQRKDIIRTMAKFINNNPALLLTPSKLKKQPEEDNTSHNE